MKVGELMSILYILSVLVLMTTFMLVKKSKKEQNIVLWIVLSFVLFLCLNSIQSFILSLVSIKSYLWLKFVINVLLSILLYFRLIRKKDKQKYYFDYIDVFYILFIMLIAFYIGYNRFGKDINVSFETTDPALHFLSAYQYYDTNTLTEKTNIIDAYGNRNGVHTMFFSYVNAGTFFQAFCHNGDFKSLYNLFVVFEMLLFVICGSLFYFTIKKHEKFNIKKNIINVILILLYLFGYPLSNLVFGFHYLGMGIFIINAILLFSKAYLNKDLYNSFVNKFCFIILMFSLFTTYYLFVPAIYGGLGLYILYLCFVRHKYDIKESVINIFVLLCIPFIIGIIYYILPPFFNKSLVSSSTALATEGYIYRNLIGNFIFLLPAALAELIYLLRNKEDNPISMVTIVTVIFTFFILILAACDKASSYYYFKFYYILWLFMYILLGLSVNSSDSDSGNFSCSYIVIYFLIVLVMRYNIEQKISDKNILFNPTHFTGNITEIYYFNNARVTSSEPQYDKGKIELIKYVKDNINTENNDFVFVGDLLQKIWFYSFTNIGPTYDFKVISNFYDDNITFNDINKNKVKCFLYFNDGEWIKDNHISSDYSSIYENSDGKIMCRVK